MLKEYFDDIGGRPEKPGKAAKTAKTAKAAGKAETGTKRKGRASIAKSETATPASSSKRAKQTKQVKEESVEKAWSPPPGSWEHDVSHIDTVEQSIDPKTGKEARYAYIVWNNQKKTQHPLKHIYTKCPQKVRHTPSAHAAPLTCLDAGILREPPRLHSKRTERRHHGCRLLERVP